VKFGLKSALQQFGLMKIKDVALRAVSRFFTTKGRTSYHILQLTTLIILMY